MICKTFSIELTSLDSLILWALKKLNTMWIYTEKSKSQTKNESNNTSQRIEIHSETNNQSIYFIITYYKWKTQQREQDSTCMNKSLTSETDSRKCEENIEQIQRFDSERITIKSSLNESVVLHSIWRFNDWKSWLLWTSQSLKKWKKSNRLLPNIYFTTTIQMKARKIETTHKYWEHYEHVFKHYANALSFRSRIRASNMKNRHKHYIWKVKMSRIQEIEVADDYRKKDFWWWYSFKFTNDWLKWEWYKKHTEWEYLYWALYFLRSQVRDEFSLEERKNNEDVKFLEYELNRIVNWIGVPKNKRDEITRETFLSCRKILKKLWKERLIQERDRWMYEDDFNAYCEKMDALQNEFNEFLK